MKTTTITAIFSFCLASSGLAYTIQEVLVTNNPVTQLSRWKINFTAWKENFFSENANMIGNNSTSYINSNYTSDSSSDERNRQDSIFQCEIVKMLADWTEGNSVPWLVSGKHEIETWDQFIGTTIQPNGRRKPPSFDVLINGIDKALEALEAEEEEAAQLYNDVIETAMTLQLGFNQLMKLMSIPGESERAKMSVWAATVVNPPEANSNIDFQPAWEHMGNLLSSIRDGWDPTISSAEQSTNKSGNATSRTAPSRTPQRTTSRTAPSRTPQRTKRPATRPRTAIPQRGAALGARSPILTLLDINQDGQLSVSELQNLIPTTHFKKLDTNKDGQLSPTELSGQ